MRRLSISLNEDLPLRPTHLGKDAMSQIFGGCVGYAGVCVSDSDCCPQAMNPGGSGGYRLKCTPNAAGTGSFCIWTPA